MEYLPIWLTQQVDMNVYDGLATDGVWGKSEMYWLYNGSQFANVDIDNNGVNDHSEHDKDWFLNHWQAGIDKMLVDLRQRIGNDKLIVINSGNRHDWGWSETNGIIVEKMEGYFDDKFSNDYFNNFKKLCPKPFISVADGLPHSSNPDMAKPTKDDFLGMRFGLVTCMFNDLYFSFQNLEADEHYWSYWYDEFDTDLGQPTGSPKEIRPGLWVRFFERGCAIAGVNGSPQTATNEDLCKFSEYFGPYFRFKGGQNPDLNNGSQFDSVSLKGRIYDDHYFGDGIILLKQPLAVIADIILDNSDSGTSPSNNPAALQDGFQQNSECSSNAYTVRCASWQDTYGYATASPGSATAVFTPNIGLAGSYQVCEWHPTFDGGASNVNYTIIHAGGQKNVKIDQNANGGRWNSLGSYFFNKGTNGKIIISASGANGIVSADAIKFVYGGTDSNRDISAPNPPGGVKIKN